MNQQYECRMAFPGACTLQNLASRGGRFGVYQNFHLFLQFAIKSDFFMIMHPFWL